MIITKYKILKMDCASEESLIRMKLDPLKEISGLEFNLQDRILTVYHHNDPGVVTQSIDELNLGSTLITSDYSETEMPAELKEINRKYLLQVLLINFLFFLIEIIVGFIANSMGLVGDSLDMLADAFVYGMALLVVGQTLLYKKRVAMLTGYLQLTLALIGYIEVTRRYLSNEAMPDYVIMIVISAFALCANILSLFFLLKSKSNEVHMKATMICTSNDIIVNAGVIIAALLVLLLASPLPDLIIGVIIFTMVLIGSIRILKLN